VELLLGIGLFGTSLKAGHYMAGEIPGLIRIDGE
jgi:hypothetical protein